MNPIFANRRERLMEMKVRRKGVEQPRRLVAPPVFDKCSRCGAVAAKAELARSLYVCPNCGYHHPIGAYLRLAMVLDAKSFRELNEGLVAPNALQFPGYEEKLESARDATGLSEAVVTARGRIGGVPVAAAVLDSRFFMGSMGVAVGEKITRCVEYAQRHRLPLIIFSASGGARMQEGILSLMQMAKTAAAVRRFQEAGGLYISFFTHPTTGGVTASFASLGDITLAEPGALIGFAGPRVIQQTIGQTLPEGFQRAEYLVEHGFVDLIVPTRRSSDLPRTAMRETLIRLLRLHGKGELPRE